MLTSLCYSEDFEGETFSWKERGSRMKANINVFATFPFWLQSSSVHRLYLYSVDREKGKIAINTILHIFFSLLIAKELNHFLTLTDASLSEYFWIWDAQPAFVNNQLFTWLLTSASCFICNSFNVWLIAMQSAWHKWKFNKLNFKANSFWRMFKHSNLNIWYLPIL